MAICLVTKVEATVDVKISTDRGRGETSSGGEVTVTFNKDFADVRKLLVTPIASGSERIYCVVTFVDAPDPEDFTVEIWNQAGDTRLVRDFYWEASGVLNR